MTKWASGAMIERDRPVVDAVRVEALDHLAVLVAEHLVGDRRHVEDDAPVHGLAEPDLVEDAAGGDVPRGRLLPDRVVGLHEPLARRVVEPGAGHEGRRLHRDAARPEGTDAAPRVELDELHVAERRAGPERERVAAARHVHRIAGDAEEAAGPAGGENRRAARGSAPARRGPAGAPSAPTTRPSSTSSSTTSTFSSTSTPAARTAARRGSVRSVPRMCSGTRTRGWRWSPLGER